MKGALIHGVLLLVMLVYGYRTWTRDKTVKPDLGNVVLWDKSEKDIASIAYKGEMREVKLEQKTANGETYWWGADTQIVKTPKPTPPKPPEPAAGSGSGSGSAAPPPTPGSGAAGSNAGSGSGSAAGSAAGSGSGSAAKPPEPPKQEFDEKRTTREFPLGEGGMKIVKGYTSARAIRDLGSINEENKKKYKLDTTKAEVTVTFKDGSSRTFKLGDAVYGNQDKYAVDDKGRGYVLSKDMLTNLELGETSLYLSDPRGFDLKKIEGVVIEGAGKVKTGIRTETDVEGRKVKTWADGETKKPHPSLGNFIDQIGALPPTEYSTKTKLDTLTPIVKVTYKDGSGAKLGSLTLLKGEKAPTMPEGGIDPANPPKGETAYYIMTEKSRVPALVRTDTAQQVETNLPVVMNEKPPEPGKSVDPKGNPFGNGPLPPTGGGSAAMPPGHGMPPGMGGDPHGAPGGDPHGAPGGNAPPPGGAMTPPGGAPAAGSAAPKAPAAGSAAAPKAPAAAPKPATGSAAAPKPAAGSAAAAPKAPAPKPAGSAAAPAAGSAK